jgi:hypothetical protein
MKINKAIVIVSCIIVLLLGIVAYLAINLLDGKGSYTKKPPGNSRDIVAIGEIPSPQAVATLSAKLVKEVWGDTFENLSEKQVLILPHSGVTFKNPVVTNNTDLAVMTVLAYLENPYLQANAGDTKRTLPNGTILDMRLLKMEYSELQFYGYSNDTSKYLIKGRVNGEYFEKSVDLVKDKVKPLPPKSKQQE